VAREGASDQTLRPRGAVRTISFYNFLFLQFAYREFELLADLGLVVPVCILGVDAYDCVGHLIRPRLI